MSLQQPYDASSDGWRGRSPPAPVFPTFPGPPPTIADGPHNIPHFQYNDGRAQQEARVTSRATEFETGYTSSLPDWAPQDPPAPPYEPVAFPHPPRQVKAELDSGVVGKEAGATEREQVVSAAHESTLEHLRRETARQQFKKNILGEDTSEESTCTTEFHTGEPRHSASLLTLITIALFGMIPLMSSFSLTVLLTGCIAMYISDFLGYRRGTVVVIILATAAFAISLFLSNIHAAMYSFGPMFMIVDIMGILICVVGISLTHFHWIQLDFPELIAATERTVHGVTPLLALPSTLATATALIGSRNAPFVFSAAMCAIHWGFYGFTPSSFLVERRTVLLPSQSSSDSARGFSAEAATGTGKRRKGGHGATDAMHESGLGRSDDGADAAQGGECEGSEKGAAVMDVFHPINITGREEAISYTILLLTLPTLTYISIQSNFFDAFKSNIMNVVGMVGVPMMYLFLNPKQSLWFLWSWEKEATAYSPEKEKEEEGTHGMTLALMRARKPALTAGYLLVLHWAVYRLLHSRYQHLFMGVAPPFNTAVMLLVAYCVTYIAFRAKEVLDADERGEQMQKHLTTRISIMLASVIGAVGFAIAIGAPVAFYPFGALSATTFNMFLIDRSNSGSLVLFTIFSSMLFMWWMYRTFSFVVVDLRVFGESTVVPTPLVAVSVLWCHLLGCMCFGMSFSETKGPFALVLVVYTLNLTWVEHVLYSQKEEGAYPAILVFFTSGLGVWLASKLFKNGILAITGAAFLAACFLAKLFTFFVEVTAEYYSEETGLSLLLDKYVAAEISLSWWACVFWAYVIAVIEIENRKQVERESISRLMLLLLASAVVMSLTSITNVQRAVYEFFSQQRVTPRNHVHIAIGTSLITFGILTAPFLQRHLSRYPSLHKGLVLSRAAIVAGAVAVALQPTQVLDHYQSQLDYELLNADTGRYLSLVGISLLVVSRMLPMAKVPQLLRAFVWLTAAIFLSCGLTVSLLPAPTISIGLGVSAFVFLSILTLDVSHYRRLTAQEGWIVYGISVASMVFTFIALGRVDLHKMARGNVLIMWEMHDVGRMHLLAVTTAVNLFMAVVLKFRISGKALLPYALPLNEDIIEQVGLVCNYSTFLAVSTMTVLNYWGNDNEPGIHIATSLLLLLLVNDNTLFVDLDKRGFRYFPPLLFALVMLWASLLLDAFMYGGTAITGVVAVLKTVFYTLPVLPSHLSLLSLLWYGQKRGGMRMGAILAFVVLDAICLLLSTRQIVQWMAIVGACGQIARLYEAQFWRKRIEVLL